MDFEEQSRKVFAQKQIIGLIYGAAAGLVYAFVAWGFDGIRLALAHGAYPFLQFVIGCLPCALLGAIVGWLVYRLNHMLAACLLWGLTGYFFAWMASHVPFDFLSTALGILDPSLRAIVNYPLAYSPPIYIAGVALAAVAGLLEIWLVDSSAYATAPFGRIFPLAFWAGIFLLAAIPPENIITSQLSQPVVATNAAIQYTLAHLGDQIDPQTAFANGMLAVKPLQGLLNRPRRLILGSYDDLLYSTKVIIDFNGDWAACSVVNGTPSVCQTMTFAGLQQYITNP